MHSEVESDRHWSFVTNHARVLACIAADPNTRLRDIAAAVGVTERTAAHIVSDLEQAGYLSKSRDGRRNQYVVRGFGKLRHPRLKGLPTNQLIALLLEVLDRQPLM
jgi:DNA-binding MarR family transcriptional regulator